MIPSLNVILNSSNAASNNQTKNIMTVINNNGEKMIHRLIKGNIHFTSNNTSVTINNNPKPVFCSNSIILDLHQKELTVFVNDLSNIPDYTTEEGYKK